MKNTPENSNTFFVPIEEEVQKLQTLILSLENQNDSLNLQVEPLQPSENSPTVFISIEEENATLRQENQSLNTQIKYLKFQVEQLKKVVFGSKRDFVPPREDAKNQLYLFDTPVQVEEEPSVETKPKSEKPKRKAKRKKVPPHLETIEVVIPAPESKKKTASGEELILLGYEVSEKLHQVPAKFQRLLIKREKYGYKNSREVLYTAPPPKCIVEKGRLSDTFIQEIVFQKYFLGVPLYRQIQNYKSQGVELAKSSLSDVVKQFANFYRPVWKAIGREVFSQKWIQTDSTPIKCSGLQKEKMKQTQFWGYRNTRGCYFIWGKTKSHKEILNVFEEFGYLEENESSGAKEKKITWEGYLMADADPAYVTAMKGQKKRTQKEEVSFLSTILIVLMACLAHVRRKFVALYKEEALAKSLVEQIDEVYRLESRLKDERKQENWSDQEFYERRGKMRQDKSKPLMDSILKTISEEWNSGKHPPQSALGKALSYAHNLEERLKVFLTDGELPIDNNEMEGNIKGCVIGRKNYLFIGSEDAGEWAALCHSLIESCRQLGIDPREYLEKSTIGLLNGEAPEKLTPYAMREQIRAFATNF